MANCNVLVLYYSRHGSVKALANKIAQGIEQQHCEAILRTVPEISTAQHAQTQSTEGDPYVSAKDLINCNGLALGSPVQFGNMAAAMKYFWDSTTPQWLAGQLINKPATVFTSSSSMHGGNEATLLTMMLPLLHHGMVISGTPYSEPSLLTTASGGTPYGVTHVSGTEQTNNLTNEEITLAISTGKRLAMLAQKLGSVDL